MDINATLIGQMITFAIFVWFTMKFVWPPLEQVLKTRQEKIAAGLQAAERGHQELEIAQKYAIQHIHEARAKATETLDLAKKRASQIVDEAKKEANVEKEKIIQQGHAEVEQERLVAQLALQNEVARLAVLTAEKLLKRTISDNDQKDLLKTGENLG